MEKSPQEHFRDEIVRRSELYKNSGDLRELREKFHEYLAKTGYAHNFFWLGRPIIQLPQDVQVMQEIIWDVGPDLIVETGIAWGGSIVFSASMLVLLEACGKIKNGEVAGIDIEIRPHNKESILEHPLSKKIKLFEGSSVDSKIVEKITELTRGKNKILVFLDSDHTHEHVLAELKAYAPLVSVGSYCVVGDTAIEDVPGGTIAGRVWGRGNNPKTAVFEFLRQNGDFIVDTSISDKLLLTSCPGGFLKRIR